MHRQKDAVVARRITKSLRRQTQERPEVTEAVAQLAYPSETQPDLRQAAVLQSALLRAMYAAPVAALPIAMTAEDAAAQLAGGVPLLRNVSLPCVARDQGEEPRQRIATCDACQSYLKLRSTLTPLTTPQLLVEEIALVHLDLIAMDKGYSPPL